ncbi:MAG: (Fe-S)-binding protein, partial [Candidatus Krumholzibacteria bacterium]|nr:(Fe-S)-binding protein [Candidatus Krumholzibacteria bacterium]
ELCLHCLACEENCPSGMRAGEVVMAVRAEMARRGLLPRLKRIALKALEGMDNSLFKMMRAAGLVRKAPLHGIGGKSPLSFFFPMLGWPREKFIPLLKDKPFLGSGPERFRASDLDVVLPDPDAVRHREVDSEGAFDTEKAVDIVKRIAAARRQNLDKGACAYFFVGHAVNHFFPEEAEAVVRVLNLLGVDVLAPKDQLCCGAPVYFAGDIDGARRAASATLERFADHHYDWVVTSCSSGGLMLKETFPRLFDLTSDGYFEITWDPEIETFRRLPGRSRVRQEYPRAQDLYREYIEGKIYDIDELIVRILGIERDSQGFEAVFGAGEEAKESGDDAGSGTGGGTGVEGARYHDMPVVTYHHPCHLKRGQGVEWEPEIILEKLPGHRYVRMQDADRCCGGGGSFTFTHSDASEAVAGKKMDAVAEVRPDIVATACPICRVQLMDMLRRRFVLEAEKRGETPWKIPVKTPVELFLEDLEPILQMETSGDR